MLEINQQHPDGMAEEVRVDAMREAESPPSFPEGGTKAWSVVLGCFCIMFYTFGYLNAFG